MTGERLLEVYSVETRQSGWPDYFVQTDKGVYLYTGSAFSRHDILPPGSESPLPEHWKRQEITRVFGDGETTIILLSNGSAGVVHVRDAVPLFGLLRPRAAPAAALSCRLVLPGPSGRRRARLRVRLRRLGPRPERQPQCQLIAQATGRQRREISNVLARKRIGTCAQKHEADCAT